MSGFRVRPSDILDFGQGQLREFETFTGTRVVVAEGVGTVDRAWREVTYWFDEEGVLIRRLDPVPDSGVGS